MAPGMLLLLKIIAFALFIIGAVINFTAKYWIKAPVTDTAEGEDADKNAEIEDMILNRRLKVKTFALWLVIICVVILFILYR